jgi:hypothetical protein
MGNTSLPAFLQCIGCEITGQGMDRGRGIMMQCRVGLIASIRFATKQLTRMENTE